jgi:hypothetical protein
VSRARRSTPFLGLLVFLFSVLCLLPAFHLHPAYEHTHGPHGTHAHLPVVHVDFLPIPDHDSGEHSRGHGLPGDPSPQPFSQISFPTILPRGLILFTRILEKISIALPVKESSPSVSFSSYTWGLRQDHAPPIQTRSSPPSFPRSPPLFV